MNVIKKVSTFVLFSFALVKMDYTSSEMQIRQVGKHASAIDIKNASFKNSNYESFRVGDIIIVPDLYEAGKFIYGEIADKQQYNNQITLIVIIDKNDDIWQSRGYKPSEVGKLE